MKKVKTYIFLHLLLAIYSLSTVFSKFAGRQSLLSKEFIFCYGMIVILLGIYAIGWQQVIKSLPLTSAYANKAITIVWGLIWGLIIFSEEISLGKLVGALLVISGVILFSVAGAEDE